jgi:hypothetical protein
LTASKALMPPIYVKLFNSNISQSKAPGSTNLEILDVLTQGLDFDATDPRDKLFVMLQFGSETWGFDSLPSTITPNYNRPTLEVFSLFTKWWVMEHRSLRSCLRSRPSNGEPGKRLVEELHLQNPHQQTSRVGLGAIVNTAIGPLGCLVSRATARIEPQGIPFRMSRR